MHRVRCVPDGAHRKVQIGTEHSNGTFDWYDFVSDTVGLNPDGLSTPAVVEIRRRRSDIVPIGANDAISSASHRPVPALRHSTGPAGRPHRDRSTAQDPCRPRERDAPAALPGPAGGGHSAGSHGRGERPHAAGLGSAAAAAPRRGRRQIPVPAVRSRPRKPKRLPAPTSAVASAQESAAPLCGRGAARNGSLAVRRSARRGTSWTASPSRFRSPMPKSRNWFRS